MTIRTIVTGDWGQDGHNRFNRVLVETPDQFSDDDLRENFNRNVEKFGFSPLDLFKGYEDNYIPEGHLQDLLDAGAPFVYEVDGDLLWEEESISTPEGVGLLMFFLGHGLEGFTWRDATNDFKLIVGGYDTILGSSPSFYGYGLYYG